MLAARQRTERTTLLLARASHCCAGGLDPAGMAAVDRMAHAMCWAFGTSGQVLSGLMKTVAASYGPCVFCQLFWLFEAPEPSPPLWFYAAFGRAFAESNPDVSPELAELAQHLVWGALACLGVRSSEDAVQKIQELRPALGAQ